MINIVPVSTKADLKSFIDFPHELYAGDKNYVPELFIAQRDMLNPKHHPFFNHAEVQSFVAKKDGKVVGRIAAIVNQNHIKHTGQNEAFFGFFDVVEDYDIAKKILDTAVGWLKSKGFTHVIGPVNFSTNDPCGLLIDGFNHPPQIMMTYNKVYYQTFLEKYGFQKRMDLFSYWFDEHTIPERVFRIAKGIEERLNRSGITIRTVNLKDFKNEISKIKRVYNEAWDDHWGFVPMTDKEFDYVANDMKLIMDKDLVLVAEKDGEMIAFTLVLPNINEALIKIKRGRLLPTGILKLLYYKQKIKSVRVLTLGILKPYRQLGIAACLYAKVYETGRKKGFTGADASWILEDNVMMNRELQNINSKVYKTHRMYNLAIPA